MSGIVGIGQTLVQTVATETATAEQSLTVVSELEHIYNISWLVLERDRWY